MPLNNDETKPALTGRFVGRVQFIAVKDKLTDFVEQGYSKRQIFEFYQKKGLFTLSYASFLKYFNTYCPQVKRGNAQRSTSYVSEKTPEALPVKESIAETETSDLPATVHSQTKSPKIVGGTSPSKIPVENEKQQKLV